MKKSVLIAGAVFFALALTSCKKEYTCECSKTYTGENGSTTEDYAVYTYKDNLVEAEDRCNDNERTDSDIFGSYTINCDIDD